MALALRAILPAPRRTIFSTAVWDRGTVPSRELVGELQTRFLSQVPLRSVLRTAAAVSPSHHCRLAVRDSPALANHHSSIGGHHHSYLIHCQTTSSVPPPAFSTSSWARAYTTGSGSGERESAEDEKVTAVPPPAKRVGYTERVKVIIKEYGTVAVVFHTVMSLFSLGSCYLVVKSGVDVEWIIKYFNLESSSLSKGASTFAIAYVLHKLFLPIRCTITVGSVPLIVRAFRARGWMKGVTKTTTS